MKSLIFYVGAHKTATSLLRSLIDRNARELESKFSISSINRSRIIENPFFDCVRELEQGRELPPSAFEKGRAHFLELIDTCPCNTVLLHCEDFYSSMFFNHADKVSSYYRYVTAGMDAKVILYVRSQPSYIESWYMQLVHIGEAVPFEEYYASLDLNSLSWWRVVQGISLFTEAIKVVPYESIFESTTKFINNFFSECGAEVDCSEYLVENQNRSFSGIAYNIAMYAYSYLNEEERHTLRKFLQEHFSTRTHEPASFLSSAARKHILDMHRKGNLQLFEQYLPEYDPRKLGYVE